VSSAALACASPAPKPTLAPPLEPGDPGARADPTVRGARLVPESIALTPSVVSASGAARGVVQGIRFLSGPHGAVRTADDPIDDPSLTLPLPARLGGGFLFVVGDTVYRADEWLGPVRPIFRSSRGLEDATAGLDRVYVRTDLGAHVALDPTTGAALDLGPWPADPHVGPYVAMDGWRAIALTDVRGPVGTADAGRTWVNLEVPLRVQSLTAVRRDVERDAWVEAPPAIPADAVVLRDGPPRVRAPRPGAAATAASSARCYLVNRALAVSPLATCDDVKLEAPPGPDDGPSSDALTLRAAVADGWPLGDGTAVVLEDGSLARISLADGSLVSLDADAVDRRLVRCHAVDLARAEQPGGFGFVCGEPPGRTAVLAYDRRTARVSRLRTFRGPRIVQPTGNGSLLVHGPCEGEIPASRPPATYCVGVASRGAAAGPYGWWEARLDDAPGAATVTSDGRVASVPTPAGLDDGRLLLRGPDGATEAVRLRLEQATGASRHFAARAVWLGDLQERRPGVLGGWLAADGTVVGVEIDRDGAVKLGGFVRDLGSPFVAGRYGLGWTRSRLGYETTDGGMTWTRFVAPTPLAPSRVRACGPAGCLADGWIRVGWGERAAEPAPRIAPSVPLRSDPPAPLWLTCRMADVPSPAGVDARFAPPTVARGDEIVHVDLFGFDAGQTLGPVGRIYAWGPATGEWSGLGQWVTLWRSPFGGTASVASSGVLPAPFRSAEGARADLGLGRSGPASWTLVVGQEPSHALIVTRRPGHALDLAAVDEGGAQVPIRRVDGEPWGAIDAALRVGSEWLIAAPESSQRAAVVLYRADPDGARRVATVPRLLAGPSSGAVRLARGGARGTLGVVVDGEPTADRRVVRRWVVPVSLESGQLDAPEPIGAADLSDRGPLAPCGDETGAGWTLEMAWPGASVRVDDGSPDAASLRQVQARVRVSSGRACLERLAGRMSEDALAHLRAERRAPEATAGAEPHLPVVVVSDAPHALLCDRAPR
jgi:hypothetical protein